MQISLFIAKLPEQERFAETRPRLSQLDCWKDRALKTADVTEIKICKIGIERVIFRALEPTAKGTRGLVVGG